MKELYTYFNFHINNTFFYNILKPLLNNKDYIKINQAVIIFDIPLAFVKKQFKLYFIEDNEYIKVSDIIIFLKEFINNYNSSNHLDEPPFYFYDIFHTPDITPSDIIKIFYNYRQGNKLNPFKIALYMIKAEKKDIEISILDYILYKLKED